MCSGLTGRGLNGPGACISRRRGLRERVRNRAFSLFKPTITREARGKRVGNKAKAKGGKRVRGTANLGPSFHFDKKDFVSLSPLGKREASVCGVSGVHVCSSMCSDVRIGGG